MELGALTAMEFGFRERELVLDIFEMVSGLRMNSAYIRPGGVAQDLPEDGVQKIRRSEEHTSNSSHIPLSRMPSSA